MVIRTTPTKLTNLSGKEKHHDRNHPGGDRCGGPAHAGFPRTLEGSIVGWALSFHDHAYIEFTITSDDLSEALDIQFNIQGPIIDQMVPAHAISVAQFEIHNQGAAHE